MATPVLMPKQGNSVESCIIVQWMKNEGDAVSAGDPICEIETDKSTFEVEAPEDGTLIARFFEADDDVPVMVNIAVIGNAGEDASSFRPSEAGAASEAPAAAPEAAAETAAPAPAPVANAPASTPTNSGPSEAISPRARNLAAEKGIDASSLAGTGPDGRVIERDVLAAAANAPRTSAAAQAALSAGGVHAPAQGSGLGGMVTAADLQSGAAPAAANTAIQSSGGYSDTPVKGIRKVIAERMQASLQNSAQLTMNASCCAESLLAYRKQLKAQAEALGLPNITINDMIVYAVSRVLKRHPLLNAHFLGSSIRQFDDVHLGVAVDTERGLLVPVLRDADKRSLANISEVFKPLAIACQAGKASPDDLQGGTFTITNLGNLGIDSFTPVLNVPEVAILGVGGLSLKPYPGKDGDVVFKQSMGLSLTIDHQAIDGAPGARFLKDLVTTLENFSLALAA